MGFHHQRIELKLVVSVYGRYKGDNFTKQMGASMVDRPAVGFMVPSGPDVSRYLKPAMM